jgi:asparaginyl-tRNA synthetase
MKNYKFPIQSIRQILKLQAPQESITVNGYIKTIRSQKTTTFLEVSDGSTVQGLQSIMDTSKLTANLGTGTSVQLQGSLVASPNRKQSVELQIQHLKVLGDATDYPMHKGRIPLDVLRELPHLRSRSNLFASLWRIRNTLIQGIHSFFQSHDFLLTNTPVFTSSDCEGGGEAFQVTTAQEKPFFGRPVYTTVSSQLHLEVLAHAMSRVYTLGPAFRAEPSDSTRHLAEFWMLEAEVAYLDNLNLLLDLIEAQTKYSIHHLLTHAPLDLDFCDQYVQKGQKEMLQRTMDEDFGRMTYSEAIEILSRKTDWKFPVKWGLPLQTEHEKYLAENVQKGPLFITEYPKLVKPFYMKQSEDMSTVYCTDLVVPKWGEIVGGSLRESNLAVLQHNMKQHNISEAEYQYYLDIRRYGSVPLAGYGMGFERLLGFATGMSNIRDLIPFPRYLGHCRH